jgi:hypothetical protein
MLSGGCSQAIRESALTPSSGYKCNPSNQKQARSYQNEQRVESSAYVKLLTFLIALIASPLVRLKEGKTFPVRGRGGHRAVRRRGSNSFCTGGHYKTELYASPVCSVSLWYTVFTQYRRNFMNKKVIYRQQKIVNISRWRPLPENIGEKAAD